MRKLNLTSKVNSVRVSLHRVQVLLSKNNSSLLYDFNIRDICSVYVKHRAIVVKELKESSLISYSGIYFKIVNIEAWIIWKCYCPIHSCYIFITWRIIHDLVIGKGKNPSVLPIIAICIRVILRVYVVSWEEYKKSLCVTWGATCVFHNLSLLI